MRVFVGVLLGVCLMLGLGACGQEVLVARDSTSSIGIRPPQLSPADVDEIAKQAGFNVNREPEEPILTPEEVAHAQERVLASFDPTSSKSVVSMGYGDVSGEGWDNKGVVIVYFKGLPVRAYGPVSEDIQKRIDSGAMTENMVGVYDPVTYEFVAAQSWAIEGDSK